MQVVQLHKSVKGFRAFTRPWKPRTVKDVTNVFLNAKVTEDMDPADMFAKIQTLEIELIKVRESSYQEGHTYGYKEATIALNDRIQKTSAEFGQGLIRLKDQYNMALKGLNTSIVSMAIGLAKQVVRTELSKKEAQEVYLLREIATLLEEFVENNPVNIRINPEHMQWINGSEYFQAVNEKMKKEIRLIPDASIIQGECILESSEKIIDSTLKQKYAIIEEQLMKTFAE